MTSLQAGSTHALLHHANEAPSKRVLLAWEHGRNFGHMSRLVAIAKKVSDCGMGVAWAVPRPRLDATRSQSGGVWWGEAPVTGVNALCESARSRPNSFADLLIACGFAHTAALQRNIHHWLRLFDAARADAIVLDYAPTAQLAALIAGLPAAQITNGFDAPPPNCPLFGFGMRGPMLERRNAEQVSRIDDAIGDAAASVGARLDTPLASLLRYPSRWYDCIPETDPYGPRDDGRYLGPTMSLSAPLNVDWPDGADDAPKVFVYLREAACVHAVLAALQQLHARVICVWPTENAEALYALCDPSRIVVRNQVDLSVVIPSCDAVINYGSSALVSLALLNGKPQLMLPTDVEKWMVASRVESCGAGTLIDHRQSREAIETASARLLACFEVRCRATAIGTNHCGYLPTLQAVVERFLLPMPCRPHSMLQHGSSLRHSERTLGQDDESIGTRRA